VSTPRNVTCLTAQEISDMLHKLLTESTKLKAVLVISGFPIVGTPTMATLDGTLKSGPGEMFAVLSDDGGKTSSLTFDPNAAMAVTYGDDRNLSRTPPPGFPRLQSGLIFKYDGYAVGLFDISNE
jgi:hypothetical protein